MTKGFIYRQLAVRPYIYTTCGLLASVWGFGFLWLVIWFTAEGMANQSGPWTSSFSLSALLGTLICGAVPALIGVALIAVAVAERRSLPGRHPAVLALARYGDPLTIVAAVDAEMAQPTRVVQIGQRGPSLRLSSRGADSYSVVVYVTPDWLVCVRPKERDFLGSEGEDLIIFRLDDLVFASRVPPPSRPLASYLARPVFQRQVWVALIDRHGAGVDLSFPEADAMRLLAEILGRVPWAVSRFGPAPQAVSAADVGYFIAEAGRRREAIRLNDQTPPTSPS
jgi:hypothetical protein